MDAPGPALGVDFGERRIGLAISDPLRRLAVPLTTLERSDDRSAIADIVAIVEREGVTLLVVGEPRALDGTLGEAARRTARFAAKLRRATGLPCRLVDESLTSDEAARRLRRAGVAGRRRREHLDAVAAQILLEAVLADAGESQ